VNIDGDVVGINTAVNAAVSGIGFAIPINIVRDVAESLIDKGKVVRGYLGIVPQEITPALAEAEGLDDTRGIIVATVEAGTPADEAGIKSGDVILEFAGTRIEGVNQFRRVVAGVEPGEKVTVALLRNGEEKSVTATLRERPDETAAAETAEPQSGEKWLGIEVVGLDDPVARRAQVSARQGVLIVAVEQRSHAADAGLAAGDVILEIGDRDIAGLSDYQSATKSFGTPKRAIAFRIQRGDAQYFVAVEPE
jgi:serine protease Do